MTTTHAELIARLEASSGPDRELDRDIYWECRRESARIDYWNAATGMPRDIDTMTSPLGMKAVEVSAPHYTSCIDYALSLVPEDRELVLAHCKFEPIQCWEAILDTKDYDAESRRGSREIATAPTPAIALCIAALRARASLHARSAS